MKAGHIAHMHLLHIWCWRLLVHAAARLFHKTVMVTGFSMIYYIIHMYLISSSASCETFVLLLFWLLYVTFWNSNARSTLMNCLWKSLSSPSTAFLTVMKYDSSLLLQCILTTSWGQGMECWWESMRLPLCMTGSRTISSTGWWVYLWVFWFCAVNILCKLHCFSGTTWTWGLLEAGFVVHKA